MKYDSYRIMPFSEKCPFYFRVATDNAVTSVYLVRREGDEVKGSMLLLCGFPKTRRQAKNMVYRLIRYLNKQLWRLEEAGNEQ